jgi:hypothetical protein
MTVLSKQAYWAGIVLSVILIFFILELVRRRRLREEYSLLWLLVGVVMLVVAIWSPALTMIAKLVGIYYPPSALFLLGLIFIVILLLHLTTVISTLTEHNKRLAQEVALLNEKVDNLLPDELIEK